MFIGKRKSSIVATIVFNLSILLGLAVLVMLFGARLGLWEPIEGFIYSRNYTNPIGYTIVGLSVATFTYLLSKRHLIGKKKSVISLIIGLAILGPLISSKVSEKISYPPIHDISTDTVNPPLFITLTDNRPGAKNTLVYGGPEIAAQQIAAFPDIKPIMSTLPPAGAYAKALKVGEAMGWKIIGADPIAFRFEGIAETPFFKFVDDTVVVVSATMNGSRIDVRSVSRIGRGDIGVNAIRIREFIKLFNQ